MTADAPFVTGDSKRWIQYERQLKAGNGAASQPEKTNADGSGSTVPSTSDDSKQKELPTKGKAYAKWVGTMVGDTLIGGWNQTTFRKPREGIEYQQ